MLDGGATLVASDAKNGDEFGHGLELQDKKGQSRVNSDPGMC